MKFDATESVPIQPSIPTTPAYVLYPQRFYALFVFSFLTFNQCFIWLTFSPIARNAETYYNITDATIDLLLNWGPIIFISCLPLTYILLTNIHCRNSVSFLYHIKTFLKNEVAIIFIVKDIRIHTI